MIQPMSDSSDAQLHQAQLLESQGRVEEAIGVLRSAAHAQDAAAIGALGKHLMVHRPDCAKEGLEALLAAARAGNGESAHILAVFIAEGVSFAQTLALRARAVAALGRSWARTGTA
jgi:hypothetical protein